MHDSLLHLLRFLPFFAAATILSTGCTQTFSIEVDNVQKINESNGNFSQTLVDGDEFGSAITNIGDVDNDGVIDLAVGAAGDDDGGSNRGAVWILLMDDNGQVDITRKVSDNTAGFGGVLDDSDQFGYSVSALGDLNNDGFLDIAVGAPGDDDGGTDRGALWILFLDANGAVLSWQKISSLVGGLGNVLNDDDRFGAAVANIGDLNRDGVIDLAVGATHDDDSGTDSGAVWILFMNSDGTVAAQQKISSATGGFSGGLQNFDHFGAAIVGLTDLDGNGINDIAVGAPGTDVATSDQGAVWVLLMNSNGTVSAEQQITNGQGEFDGFLNSGDQFGNALANLGDLNNDGIAELGVGAELTDHGGAERGSIWILFMRDDATVISSSQISAERGNLGNNLIDGDHFGHALVSLGDLDNDGVKDIVVTASGDNGNGLDRGAIWVLFMAPVTTGVRVDQDINLFTYYAGRGG